MEIGLVLLFHILKSNRQTLVFQIRVARMTLGCQKKENMGQHLFVHSDFLKNYFILFMYFVFGRTVAACGILVP